MRKWIVVLMATVFCLSLTAGAALAEPPFDPKKRSQQQPGTKSASQRGMMPPGQQKNMQPPQQVNKPPMQQGNKPPTGNMGGQQAGQTPPQFQGQGYQFQQGGQGFMPGTNPNVMYHTGPGN